MTHHKPQWRELVLLSSPVLFLAGAAVLLGKRTEVPIPSRPVATPTPVPASAIAAGRYLSVERVKIGKIPQWEKPGYPESDTKIQVTLLYSGPRPRKNIRFSIGGRTVNSSQESPVLVDSKGEQYRFNIIVSGAGAHEGESMRRCTYEYYVNVKQFTAPGRVVLKHRVSADYSYPIPIWIVVRK